MAHQTIKLGKSDKNSIHLNYWIGKDGKEYGYVIMETAIRGYGFSTHMHWLDTYDGSLISRVKKKEHALVMYGVEDQKFIQRKEDL